MIPTPTERRFTDMTNTNEFSKRREELLRSLGKNSIAVIPSAQMTVRNRDVEHEFRQDSDFFYLTGFEEPNAMLVLAPNRKHGETILFCQERNPEIELWTGKRMGPENATAQLGVDDAFPIDDVDDILPGLIENKKKLFFTLGQNEQQDKRLITYLNKAKEQARSETGAPQKLINLSTLLHEMRLHKSANEIAKMRKAAKITAMAHAHAMKNCHRVKYEYQLEAMINYSFAMNGAKRSAYPAIVGSGENGCILHYTENRAPLTSGDLVLIDAGCEFDYYAADITRTFPVSGKFSPEQQALYELTLEAQKAAIAAIKPGASWHAFHEVATETITQGLIDLGLLAGSLSENLESERYKAFFMHKTGHWLGMDVHDVGDYKIDQEWRVLEKGMAMTVEPGIYVAPNNLAVDEKWRGIGIRIEDDVVVNKSGCEVLTADAPKEVAEIEALMQSLR